MRTVTEMAKAGHVTVKTLRHYDKLGLLPPTQVTEAGYRLYDDDALERLYLILIFKELGFPLGRIRDILDAPDFDRNRVLEAQIGLLERKKVHLQNRIHMARGIQMLGVNDLEWEDFDVNKIDEYSAQAQALYGKTEAWKECQQKSAGRTRNQEAALGEAMMALFTRLGAMVDLAPESEAAQAWVKELRSFITEHYYTCTPDILRGLGAMYAGGGSMTENIDAAGGPGTGALAKAAIDVYCNGL